MTGVSARHDIDYEAGENSLQICECVRSVLLHICGPSMHIILSDGDTLTYPDLILDLMPRTSD